MKRKMDRQRRYPLVEPEALRLLALHRGPFATVESKSKEKSKSPACRMSFASFARPGTGSKQRRCSVGVGVPPSSFMLDNKGLKLGKKLRQNLGKESRQIG